jgi:hypothetical protein
MVARLKSRVVVVLQPIEVGGKKIPGCWKGVEMEVLSMNEVVMRMRLGVVMQSGRQIGRPLRRSHRRHLRKIQPKSPLTLRWHPSSVVKSKLLTAPLSLPTLAH